MNLSVQDGSLILLLSKAESTFQKTPQFNFKNKQKCSSKTIHEEKQMHSHNKATATSSGIQLLC